MTDLLPVVLNEAEHRFELVVDGPMRPARPTWA